MKITRADASFTQEELERFKQLSAQGKGTCKAIDCCNLRICEACPLNRKDCTDEDAIAYIESHLQGTGGVNEIESTGMCREVDSVGRIFIPKAIRKEIGFKEGDFFEFLIDNENQSIILKRVIF